MTRCFSHSSMVRSRGPAPQRSSGPAAVTQCRGKAILRVVNSRPESPGRFAPNTRLNGAANDAPGPGTQQRRRRSQATNDPRRLLEVLFRSDATRCGNFSGFELLKACWPRRHLKAAAVWRRRGGARVRSPAAARAPHGDYRGERHPRRPSSFGGKAAAKSLKGGTRRGGRGPAGRRGESDRVVIGNSD